MSRILHISCGYYTYGLWSISFHAVAIFGLSKDLLFKSVLGRCDVELQSGNAADPKEV